MPDTVVSKRLQEDHDPRRRGLAGAHQELIELAGKLKAPIVHAMRGKEFIEYDVDHGFIGDTKTTIGALLNTQGLSKSTAFTDEERASLTGWFCPSCR